MTRRLVSTTSATILSLAAALAAQPSTADLEALYRAGGWFELRPLVTERAPTLIRGAVASAFNDSARAERLLRDVIRSQPKSAAADAAYGTLCRAYVSAGQYQRFVATYREWASAFPSSSQLREQKDSVERFGGRPDQVNGPRRAATVRHDDNSFSVPVSMNGKTDDFLLDTGALHSMLTDREAKTFGLTVSGDIKIATGASGDTVAFRTAVAKTVIGPARVLLRPAHVTLQWIATIGGECCIGNAGLDLLTQGQTLSIDFSTMTLRLQ